MGVENKFTIEVSGKPLQGMDIEVTIRTLHRAMLKINPEVLLEEFNFARINYRFKWSGRTVFIEQVDDAWNRIRKIVPQKLESWMYSIKLSYTEKEET